MREFIKQCSKGLSAAATGITLYSYYLNLKQKGEVEKLNEQIEVLQRKSTECEARANKLETERLVSEAENFELDAIKSKLEVSNAKIAINRENAECANSPEAFNKATEDLFEETGKNFKLLDRAIDILSKKFTDSGSDVIENIKEIFNNYINFLDTLTLHQLGSLANLLAAIFILFCLFSVIVIIYSNIILNYLKLEEKFPRLANFIHYRKKFQNFFLFINLLLIVITLLSTIFVNLSALIS